MPPQMADVNVHPGKMEIRFADQTGVYEFISASVHIVLHGVELMPKATLDTAREELIRQREEAAEAAQALQREERAEPFEHERVSQVAEPSPVYRTEIKTDDVSALTQDTDQTVQSDPDFFFDDRRPEQLSFLHPAAELPSGKEAAEAGVSEAEAPSEEDLSFKILSPENAREYEIIGQIFDTYWILQFRDKVIVMDQHAAHEKVNFERIMKRLSVKNPEGMPSQQLMPPIVIHLTGKEEGMFLQYRDVFTRMGYEIEEFGSGSYAVRAIPLELYGNEPEELLRETLGEMLEEKIGGTPDAILYKIASMSCKAAVKGNMTLSREEITALIDELLSLDNPYHCPHGRPTMVVLSQQEIERKFKRIV